MPSVIIYRETSWNARRSFHLHDDHISVQIKSFNLDVESKIFLSDLSPNSEKLRLRPLVPYRIGSFLLIIAVFCLLMSALFVTAPTEWRAIAAVAGVSQGILSIPFLLFSRKIEYVRFKSHQSVPLLDVGRSGPDKSEFSSFIALLTERIQSSQKVVRSD